MGIKWIVKKSDFTEIRKSVSKEADSKKLEQLKKEVIAILEKKDSQEYKKAIEYFEETEIRYSHLEKSISGDWIEKAGYGVGTVRIWRGKKYKKVSTNPVKWVRVFDKHDRGAATSMGKYIAQVKKCETVEELYQFCMKQRSLFQDENGVDLPIMDKLKAAIDEQSGKIESGKSEKNTADENYIKNSDNKELKDKVNAAIKKYGATGQNLMNVLYNKDKELYNELDKMGTVNAKQFIMQTNAEKYDDDKAYEEYQKLLMKENQKEDLAKLKEGNYSFDSFDDFKAEINKQAGDRKGSNQPNYIGYLKLSTDNYLKKLYDSMPKSESEKQQNRSEAMKGNQNAYKGGTEENKTKTYKTIPSFEPVDSTKAKKKNIAETTKVADGKVTIPATREIKNEIKSLLNNLDKSPVRPFMNHVYYDGENMVATDGKTLKTIKIGAIDGIEPNKYLKIDTSGKENITIEQDNENYGNFPSYKRVIPENNNQKINLNNSILKDKIEDMKKDGSIDMDIGKITLKLKDGNVYLDDVIVGSAPDVIFENNEDYINFNYKYLTNALQGNNSILAVSENNQKAMSISTSVSDNVIMPLIGVGETDYSANRTIKEESDKINAKVKAEKEAVAEDRKKRSITDEAKSDILKNKPEGVTDRDYEDLIDYTNDFYTKLGYDNSSERAKRQIKETVDNAIKKINNKDFDILESIINTDNKVSRRIFQTLTAIPLGSNQADAKKAWEKWVGHDAMKKYRDDENTKIQAEKNRVAAEKKAKEEAENEQYNGFLSSKTPAGRAKAMEILNKKGGFNGKVMSWQELADKYIAEGGHARASTYVTSGGKEKPYYSISNKDGLGYEVPKTVYDYAMHISNGVKKSIADIIMLDEYEHEDFDEDFEDFDASQPDLFNSPAYKVSAALDDVFGCR